MFVIMAILILLVVALKSSRKIKPNHCFKLFNQDIRLVFVCHRLCLGVQVTKVISARFLILLLPDITTHRGSQSQSKVKYFISFANKIRILILQVSEIKCIFSFYLFIDVLMENIELYNLCTSKTQEVVCIVRNYQSKILF